MSAFDPKRTLVALTATQFFRIGYLAFASRPDCKRETNGISDARRKRGKTFLCIEAIRPIGWDDHYFVASGSGPNRLRPACPLLHHQTSNQMLPIMVSVIRNHHPVRSMS